MKEKHTTTRKKSRNIFLNIYYFFSGYLYLALLLAGAVLSIVAFLFVLELVFPKYVHVFDYSLSKRTFTELIGAGKYNAAINFYEQKEELFDNSMDNGEHLSVLADCYMATGDYGEAEKIRLDLYNFTFMTDKQREDLEDVKQSEIDIIKFGLAKELCKLYTLMGDVVGYEEYYNRMKDHMTPQAKERAAEMVEYGDGKLPGDFTLEAVSLGDDIRMLYRKDPKMAIDSLNSLVMEAMRVSDKPDPVIRDFNQLINWIIDTDGIIQAYPIICTAVDYANRSLRIVENKMNIADLSEICYEAHDMGNAKRFYVTYRNFVKKHFAETDMEYLKSQYMGFKYLEQQGKYDKLLKEMKSCFTSLRSVIQTNFHNMNEYQREHFVSMLKEPFEYAEDLLTRYPSEELAQICYDNAVFMKGLLLRSNRTVRNSIQKLGDPSLMEKYNELLEAYKELTYRSEIRNIGNSIAVRNLEKRIYELDKEISAACAEYAKATSAGLVTSKEIRKALKNNSAAVEFIETKSGYLYALLLTKRDGVRYIPLTTREDISQHLRQDIAYIYSDEELTAKIWKPIADCLSEVETLYYSTSGIFNRIAIGSLAVDYGHYVCDDISMRLMSSTANLAVLESIDSEKTSKIQYASVWGGIDYGTAADDSAVSEFRTAITRGESITPLRFSLEEVSNIEQMLSGKGYSVNLYSGMGATEGSFRNRSSKGDYLLHLSTHGFFQEDHANMSLTNPMYNSGLFMAGADSTWVNNLPHSPNDGILRSDEIQYMDFSGCHLAVLSACETGVGYNENSEGVYGLQRAFKLAGVDKILMSLWKVSDYHTSELMKELYSNIASGMPIEKALKAAQDTIRAEYSSPLYWGGFVLLD